MSDFHLVLTSAVEIKKGKFYLVIARTNRTKQSSIGADFLDRHGSRNALRARGRLAMTNLKISS